MLPLLSNFVERPAIQRRLPLEVDSFRKITAVSQITKRAKLGLADADTLDTASIEHGEAFLPAYDGHVVPKSHDRLSSGGKLEEMDTYRIVLRWRGNTRWQKKLPMPPTTLAHLRKQYCRGWCHCILVNCGQLDTQTAW